MVQHIGRVDNPAHPAAPVVIGDFEVMKQWPGDIDGEAEGQMELGHTTVFGFTAMELGAPTVFVDGNTVSLLTKQGMTPPKPELPEPEELDQLLRSELDDVEEEGTLSISSGAIVITLAYNATPEEGAPIDHLGECYRDDNPKLPATVPTAAVFKEQLAIVPVEPGEYAVIWGSVGEYERCQIMRS